MPDTGSAPNVVFTRSDGTRTGSDLWAQEQAAAIGIVAPNLDYHDSEIATALTARRLLNGGNQPSAALPMNGFTHTGVGVATARTQYAAASQVADSTLTYAGTSSGTNTITATLSPAITAYVAGQHYQFKAGGTNTGASTINFNSSGAKDLKKGPDGATALAAGDITTGGLYVVQYDGTNFQLLNPKFPAGFATTDTPQFTGIEVGHASDTTVTRASAGDLAVESNRIFRVGGADVPIADGGTGASTAADAFTALKQAASDTATGVLEIAVQSEMETGTSTTLAVTPGRQHFHPGHPKAGGSFNGTGTPAFRSGDYGMGAITDIGAGRYTLALDTAFANTNFWLTATTLSTAGNQARVVCESGAVARTTSSLTLNTDSSFADNGVDMEFNSVAFWGDYA